VTYKKKKINYVFFFQNQFAPKTISIKPQSSKTWLGIGKIAYNLFNQKEKKNLLKWLKI
jgi:hypothetical protein